MVSINEWFSLVSPGLPSSTSDRKLTANGFPLCRQYGTVLLPIRDDIILIFNELLINYFHRIAQPLSNVKQQLSLKVHLFLIPEEYSLLWS